MKQSAGILACRRRGQAIEFFLVHPGGPYFYKRDAGWWTVPKGEINTGEEPLEAAIREFAEETGYTPQGEFIKLNPIVQKGVKLVHCWAVMDDFDERKLISNRFELAWPPKSGKMQSFPEIDKAGWFPMEEAMGLIIERQIPLLEEAIGIVISK